MELSAKMVRTYDLTGLTTLEAQVVKNGLWMLSRDPDAISGQAEVARRLHDNWPDSWRED